MHAMENLLDGDQACATVIADLRVAGVRAVLMTIVVGDGLSFSIPVSDWMFQNPEPPYADRTDIRFDYERYLAELVLGGLRASLESAGHEFAYVAATAFVDVARGRIAIHDPVAWQPLLGLEDKRGVLFLHGCDS